jgi:hypothetical protein
LRDGGDRGDRCRGRLTPIDSGGMFLVLLNLASLTQSFVRNYFR